MRLDGLALQYCSERTFQCSIAVNRCVFDQINCGGHSGAPADQFRYAACLRRD